MCQEQSVLGSGADWPTGVTYVNLEDLRRLDDADAYLSSHGWPELLRQAYESLAGRVSYLELTPLTCRVAC